MAAGRFPTNSYVFRQHTYFPLGESVSQFGETAHAWSPVLLSPREPPSKITQAFRDGRLHRLSMFRPSAYVAFTMWLCRTAPTNSSRLQPASNLIILVNLFVTRSKSSIILSVALRFILMTSTKHSPSRPRSGHWLAHHVTFTHRRRFSHRRQMAVINRTGWKARLRTFQPSIRQWPVGSWSARKAQVCLHPK